MTYQIGQNGLTSEYGKNKSINDDGMTYLNGVPRGLQYFVLMRVATIANCTFAIRLLLSRSGEVKLKAVRKRPLPQHVY